MGKVEKSTNEAMEWMNNKLNLQNKQSLTMDPVVKAKDIEAKIKVMGVMVIHRKLSFLLTSYQ